MDTFCIRAWNESRAVRERQEDEARARLQSEEDDLDVSYKAREITITAYYDRKKELAEADNKLTVDRLNDEKKLLEGNFKEIEDRYQETLAKINAGRNTTVAQKDELREKAANDRETEILKTKTEIEKIEGRIAEANRKLSAEEKRLANQRRADTLEYMRLLEGVNAELQETFGNEEAALKARQASRRESLRQQLSSEDLGRLKPQLDAADQKELLNLRSRQAQRGEEIEAAQLWADQEQRLSELEIARITGKISELEYDRQLKAIKDELIAKEIRHLQLVRARIEEELKNPNLSPDEQAQRQTQIAGIDAAIAQEGASQHWPVMRRVIRTSSPRSESPPGALGEAVVSAALAHHCSFLACHKKLIAVIGAMGRCSSDLGGGVCQAPIPTIFSES